MLRIISNSLKHVYYGSLLNLAVAHIDKFFRSRSIEKSIKDRGDTILSNRSYIGTCWYSTKQKNTLLCKELHHGAYKFYALYTTQQQLDDLQGYSSRNELESLMKILYDAEAKVKLKNEGK